MNHKIFLVSGLLILSVLMTACGTAALPQYEQDETSVAVALTVTRESLLTQGAIIPTDTPTVTPSPTVDFEATDAAIQLTADFEVALTAEFELTVAAEQEATAFAEATVAAQAEADAQATLDAAPAEVGADDPLFEAIANANPANGEMLFVVNALSSCTTCHNITADRLVGPGQYNIFARTVERIENGEIESEGPYTYLYNSIVNPNDYLALDENGVAYPAAMPMGYDMALSENELYDLVAYLVTLGD
ncbi:MAG: cytochrome c [Phototrophicaceae bacterium]